MSANPVDAIERAALRVRMFWTAWGEFAKRTICGACGEMRYCRQRTRRGRWLCLGCFEFSDEGRRWMRKAEEE